MNRIKEILLQQIKTFFLVTYSHQLTNGEASTLANILFSKSVTPELVSFALRDEGCPHSCPDGNFVPEKIFS